MTQPEFKAWPKTPRYRPLQIVITEKMDGTNSCIIIDYVDGELDIVGVQSRKRFIVVGDDNFGFAGWVEANKQDLLALGKGYHYGEWVGPGIQKNPHKLEEKAFYLFNTSRPRETLPACVKQVPLLYIGDYDEAVVQDCLNNLYERAKDEEYEPEGIIIYFPSSRTSSKLTFQNTRGKWRNETKESAPTDD